MGRVADHKNVESLTSENSIRLENKKKKNNPTSYMRLHLRHKFHFFPLFLSPLFNLSDNFFNHSYSTKKTTPLQTDQSFKLL